MPEVLVVFGSSSDASVYKLVGDGLKAQGIDYSLRLCSAHKNPEDLDALLQDSYRLVIAGAGLAAHLPGVIASKTLRPVIGVPCSNSFGGLDALLSIMQMPPGIPVLAVGVDKGESAATYAARLLSGFREGKYRSVNVVSSQSPEVELRCLDFLAASWMPVSYGENMADAINIQFAYLGEQVVMEGLTVFCPVANQVDAKDAGLLLQQCQIGPWVGLNNWKNAALAAMMLLNLDHRYDEVLAAFREEMRQKILKDDAAIRG